MYTFWIPEKHPQRNNPERGGSPEGRGKPATVNVTTIVAMEEARNEGLIHFISLSTHQAKVVNAAAEIEDIDVILAPVNKKGHMPSGNSRDETVSAVEKACRAGKGMALMKVLAYGDVTLEEDLKFSLSVPAHTTLIGMRNLKELEEDVEIFHRVWNQSR